MMSRRLTQTGRGAAAVEFALVLPLLLLLILGGLDWGYYFYVQQVVTNAAREGAREATLEGVDDAAAQTNAINRARTYMGVAGLDPTDATITPVVAGESVQVQIVYVTGSLTGFTEVIVPDTARATVEMRRWIPE